MLLRYTQSTTLNTEVLSLRDAGGVVMNDTLHSNDRRDVCRYGTARVVRLELMDHVEFVVR